MYAVCPSSGKILKSDSSQICVSAIAFGEHNLDTASIFYRFVGEEVFYLIAVEFQGDKGYIYFPRLDLIIKLKNALHCLMNADIINRFKADTVTNWKAVKSYLSNNAKKEVAALLGIVYANLGHYFWNEITGIQFLYENEILDKIDKFLLGKYGDTFNVGDIFTEISPDKLVPVVEKQKISKLMLENNYLAVRVTDVCVKQELANRIYDNALKKCCEAFVEKIEKAKKHFPLLWINLRGHDKVWSSRVEGYANIINSLYKDYPEIAIAFDGFPDEKTTMEKIVALIPKEITIYDALDCPLYETIVWAYSIDSYIAVISAGLTLVSWLANKPGVAHCNFGHTSDQSPWWGEVRENGIKPMFVPADCLVDLDDEHSPYCDYDFDWQLIYDRLIKIHQKYYPKQLPNSWYRGEITAQKYLAAKPGKKVDIPVIVKNLSQVIWSGGVDFSWMRCGNHWLDENGKMLQNDDGRVALKQDVKPQEKIELILTVTAPKTEGSYILELDLVQEGVTWFKNKGFPTATVEVEVKAYSLSDSGPRWETKKPPVVAEETLKILENGNYKDCLKLGESLEKEGKLDEAFAAFQRAIARNPNYSWSYHNLGKVLRKLGKLDEAAIAYRRAIELNPKFHWSHYNLGEVLEKQGKLEEAIAACRVAIELYPNLSLYQGKLEKLRVQ